MRLVSYGTAGEERLGALIEGGEKIVDLNKADVNLPVTMLDFLQGDFVQRTSALLADTASIGSSAIVGRAGVRLGSPVPRPGLIVCIGLNYKDHADEQGAVYPKVPLLFGKASGCVIGPEDDVIYPEGVEQLDYEVELGVVIGRLASKVKAVDALDYVAGYTVVNDVSARCAQYGDKQWFRGKSFDTFAPMGPALVTKDEIEDPQNLHLTCKVNGETRQDSNTGKMIHDIHRAIEYITRGITLRPGDVIATGTPDGVGVYRKPPALLKRGDVVEMEVENIGKITNRIV